MSNCKEEILKFIKSAVNSLVDEQYDPNLPQYPPILSEKYHSRFTQILNDFNQDNSDLNTIVNSLRTTINDLLNDDSIEPSFNAPLIRSFKSKKSELEEIKKRCDSGESKPSEEDSMIGTPEENTSGEDISVTCNGKLINTLNIIDNILLESRIYFFPVVETRNAIISLKHSAFNNPTQVSTNIKRAIDLLNAFIKNTSGIDIDPLPTRLNPLRDRLTNLAVECRIIPSPAPEEDIITTCNGKLISNLAVIDDIFFDSKKLEFKPVVETRNAIISLKGSAINDPRQVSNNIKRAIDLLNAFIKNTSGIDVGSLPTRLNPRIEELTHLDIECRIIPSPAPTATPTPVPEEDTSPKCNTRLLSTLDVIKNTIFTPQVMELEPVVEARNAIISLKDRATNSSTNSSTQVSNNINSAIGILKALIKNTSPDLGSLHTRVNSYIEQLTKLGKECTPAPKPAPTPAPTPKPTPTTPDTSPSNPELDNCTKELIRILEQASTIILNINNLKFTYPDENVNKLVMETVNKIKKGIAQETVNKIKGIISEAKETPNNAHEYIQHGLTALNAYLAEYNEALIAIHNIELESTATMVEKYIKELTGLLDKCTGESSSKDRNKPASTSTTSTPASTTPASTASTSSKPDDPIEFDICSKPSPDRWGVRFRYNVGTNNYNNGTSCGEDKGSSTTSSNIQHAGFKHEWFLTLLPAMRSTLSANGSVDTPGALPGLQFQIKSNVAKHKIPGFQPVFQHLGVDSIIITMIGTFTGDGGLGGIYKVDKEGKRLEGEVNEQNVNYTPWAALRNSHPDSDEVINPIHNKTIPTHNRALRQTVSYEDGEIKQAGWNPYNTSNPGWTGNVDKNQYFPSSDVAWETPQMYMTKNLLRAGMFDRDGCPGECPPPDVSEESYVKGRLNITQQQRMIGVNQDVAAAYTLRELSAYLDAYHEFTSFYKVAMHEAREMEIEINLRKNNDGLMPQQNEYLKYGRNALGILRNDTGNPSFKGIVKDLRVYHARTDRTWYMMDIEVTDYGMASNVPINLTNNLEASTRKALEELAIKQKEEGTKSSINDSEECGQAIIDNGNNVYFRISKTVVDADASYYLIDINTGFGTFAIKKDGIYTYVSNERGGSILDPKEALLYALDRWGDYLNANLGNELKEGVREGDYSKNFKRLLKELKFSSSSDRPNYGNTPLESIDSLKKVRTWAPNVFIDTATGYGIEDGYGNAKVISPQELLDEIMTWGNIRRKEDILSFVNLPMIIVKGTSNSLPGCSDETPVSTTASPTADNTTPP